MPPWYTPRDQKTGDTPDTTELEKSRRRLLKKIGPGNLNSRAKSNHEGSEKHGEDREFTRKVQFVKESGDSVERKSESGEDGPVRSVQVRP